MAREIGEWMHAGLPALALDAYLASGPFVCSAFENWESEFLQMGSYVCPTGYIF